MRSAVGRLIIVRSHDAIGTFFLSPPLPVEIFFSYAPTAPRPVSFVVDRESVTAGHDEVIRVHGCAVGVGRFAVVARGRGRPEQLDGTEGRRQQRRLRRLRWALSVCRSNRSTRTSSRRSSRFSGVESGLNEGPEEKNRFFSLFLPSEYRRFSPMLTFSVSNVLFTRLNI